MAAKPVDAQTFIRIWETSNSLEEVCERTGLQRNSASQRATTLRNKWSVDLKRMKAQNPQSLNSADLQAIDTTRQFMHLGPLHLYQLVRGTTPFL